LPRATMREKHAEAKEVLRRRMTATRREVPLQTRGEWSRAICRRVCGSEAFAEATHVVAYLPLGAEVDPHDAVAAVLATGRALYYPASEVDPTLRRARSVAPPPAEVYGEADSLGFDTASVLFLVPGIAFDETGGRLGRGRGWYDRVLCRYAHAARWGLAFALQMVTRVPVDPWDVPMDAVVTERGWVDARRSLPLPEGTR
jgi:5-formyltetrahydrofolate cyclo-ligase